MKIYCGTDIIETDRIKEAIQTQGKSFLNKVFTIHEIEYCENRKSQKYQHYAARFAAKEAIFKALSTMLNNKYDITWQNIQIKNIGNGKPLVEFINTQLENIESIDISMAHIKDYSTATAVILVN